MIVPRSKQDKSLFFTRLIGLSMVESQQGFCLVYLENDFVGKFNKSDWGNPCSVVNFYAPENLRLAWHAAAYGFLHFPEFKKWWESKERDQLLSPVDHQAHWLDKLLHMALDEIYFFMSGPAQAQC